MSGTDPPRRDGAQPDATGEALLWVLAIIAVLVVALARAGEGNVGLLRITYADWENGELQNYVRRCVADYYSQEGGGALYRYPWLSAVFPEFRTQNEVGYDGGWSPRAFATDVSNPIEQLLMDAEGLRIRVLRAGGFASIGFDPRARLAELQREHPGHYVPDATGNMTFEATPH
jgi:hypothetical protein